jgi:hypothetical protein
VTWDEYDQFARALDRKKKARENVELSTQPETEKQADAVTRPTGPYLDETFGFGRDGQPAICITHHAGMEYSYVLRGGSWDDDTDKLRSAARRGSNPEWSIQDPDGARAAGGTPMRRSLGSASSARSSSRRT